MTMISLIPTINRRRKGKKHRSQSLFCNETLYSDSDTDSIAEQHDSVYNNESDSTDDFTIPPKVMDPNELFIQTSHTNTVQSNELNEAIETEPCDPYDSTPAVDHVEGVTTTAEENVTMNGNVNAIPCLSETDDARLPSEIEVIKLY